MSDMPWKSAILRVLNDAAGPMHYADVAQAIIDNGYRASVGATPAATVAANLSQHLKGDVIRVRPGVYETTKTRLEVGARDIGLGVTGATGIPEGNDADVDAEEMGLINAFGMFWRRSEVDWSRRDARLLGAQQSGSREVDFGSQAGVYLLYDGSRVVYVGRVTEPRLGRRLWEHTRDRLTGRWDRFSWFGVRKVRADGSLMPVPGTGIAPESLIATMEALLIEGLEPPQNRRQGDGFNALEYIQNRDPEAAKRDVLKELSRLMD